MQIPSYIPAPQPRDMNCIGPYVIKSVRITNKDTGTCKYMYMFITNVFRLKKNNKLFFKILQY